MYKKPKPVKQNQDNLTLFGNPDVNDGLIELFKTAPGISVEDPSKKSRAVANNVHSAGCPIYYGGNNMLEHVATPFDQVMMDIKRNTDMYDAMSDELFGRKDETINACKTNTATGIMYSAMDNTREQFTFALLNFVISYLVENLKPELSTSYIDYDDKENKMYMMAEQIAKEVASHKYAFNGNISTIMSCFRDLNYSIIDKKITVRDSNVILMYNVCIVRNQIMTEISVILANIINSVCYGTPLTGKDYGNSHIRNNLIYSDDYNKFNHAIPSNNDIAGLYSHLNAVAIQIIANLTQSVELLLFQLIGTMNYLFSDKVEVDFREKYHDYPPFH